MRVRSFVSDLFIHYNNAYASIVKTTKSRLNQSEGKKKSIQSVLDDMIGL